MKLNLDEIEKALGVVDTTGIVLKENRDGYYAGSKTLLFLQGKGEIFGPRQFGYPSVSKDAMEFYAELFAAAPEWLRLLVERVKELESALSFYAEDDRQSVELEILESVNLRPATSALKGSI